MFAGGIFLAGSLIHLLPDAVENQALQSISHNFPLTYLLFGVGFLVMLFMDTLANRLSDLYGLYAAFPWVVRPSQEGFHEITGEPQASELGVEQFNLKNFSDLCTLDDPVAFVILVALSFHSMMEGLAIGSQEKAWDIVFAVLAHKFLAAFALGSEFITHQIKNDQYVLGILIFSLMTPMGILIGALITDSSTSDSVSSGICTSLAGGTFLYVAVMEIIPQELRDENKASNCCCLLAGYLAFSLLALWT